VIARRSQPARQPRGRNDVSGLAIRIETVNGAAP
jgi:hypothetical protein